MPLCRYNLPSTKDLNICITRKSTAFSYIRHSEDPLMPVSRHKGVGGNGVKQHVLHAKCLTLLRSIRITLVITSVYFNAQLRTYIALVTISLYPTPR